MPVQKLVENQPGEAEFFLWLLMDALVPDYVGEAVQLNCSIE